MSYVDGFLVAVPSDREDAYRALAATAATIFRECGALRVVECWGDDVPDGTTTDFKRAVKAEPNETVVFSWVEWPSKEARDAGNAKMMADTRMHDMEKVFDGKRMIYGGFRTILDEGSSRG